MAAGFQLKLKSKSPGQTLKIAGELAKRLSGGEILALQGSLGSGKTLFVQGLARGLGVYDPKEVRSPTFNLIQEHRGRTSLSHADFYRLAPQEVMGLGLEDYWREKGGWVVAVEWAEKAGGMIPPAALWIRMEIASDKERILTLTGGGQWERILRLCMKKLQK